MRVLKDVILLGNLELKTRSDLHIARKIWHMAGVSLIVLLYYLLPRNVALTILACFAIFGISLDLLRQKYPGLNDFVVHAMGMIMRKTEVNKLAGTTYLLIGVSIVVVFFPPQVAGLSLLFLAFADPIASYCGIKYGKDKLLGNKSVQGFVAAFVVCTLLCGLYLYFANFLMERIIVVSFLAGLAGALAELVPIGKADDNLTLPVLSAFALLIIFTVFGGFATP